MKTERTLVKTPWDSKVFGFDTYEVQAISRKSLEKAARLKGHFTVKLDPSRPNKLLRKYGFYYCDTLVKPFCTERQFKFFKNKKAALDRTADVDDLVAISHGAFHGRFHRDFNIKKPLADLRYDNWLRELYKKHGAFGLMYGNKLAGFFAFSGNTICLHALGKKYRGKGLAKYLWSVALRELFNMGHRELVSSISTFNVPVLNLYSSLGFRFREPLDIYHRFTGRN